MNERSYSLSELTNYITGILKVNFETSLWIRAEISEMRENANGHCYLELIEKDKSTDNIIAKIKASIWNNSYKIIKPYFEETTGQRLRSGLLVLVEVTVDFHDIYGLSLNIRDIDPTFTLGEMAVRRQEIIRKLEADGIMQMNQSLIFPALPQKIAVISSATAAGYEDFSNQLAANPAGYVFYPVLFPAIMQGERAESSILDALDSIFNHHELFDVVVIIRGGGATTDLGCFDSYELAFTCAQFPLPVITGIGHQRDMTVLDLVAFQSVKTPTAAAEYLINALDETSFRTEDLFQKIVDQATAIRNQGNQQLDNYQWKIRHALQQKTVIRDKQLTRFAQELQHSVRIAMLQQQNKINLIEKSLEKHSPAFMLQYGFTITTLNGKRIRQAADVKPGDEIKTYPGNGVISSKVTGTETT